MKESFPCLCLLFTRLLGFLIPTLLDALQYVFPILVQLQLGDHDLAGVDAERHALSITLLAGDTFDVNDVFETIDGGDFTVAAFVGASDDGDFVVFADGN